MKIPATSKLSRLPNTLPLSLTLAVLLTAPELFAANGSDTWTGAGADVNWNTAANWTGANTPPASGDWLFFDGLLGNVNTNNLAANTSFSGITFNSTAGPFNLNGNAINLSGGITNNAFFGQIVGLPIALQVTEPANTGSGVSGQLTVA